MRYRFKRGIDELELEFSEPLSEKNEQIILALIERFAKALDESNVSVETAPVPSSEGSQSETPKDKGLSAQTTPPDRRGGVRKAFISPKLDLMIDEKWIARKSVGDIVVELQRRGVPGANAKNVGTSLLNKVKAGKLTRTKEGEEYLYSVLSS
jgi:hypothetical protein